MSIKRLESILPDGWTVSIQGWGTPILNGPDNIYIVVDTIYNAFDNMVGYFINSDGQRIKVYNLGDYNYRDDASLLEAIKSFEKTYKEFYGFKWPPEYIKKG